jgi:NAD(P)H-hydrate repair Nnr-like enzyme with NAD(P)H-hydrate dehydratase domain
MIQKLFQSDSNKETYGRALLVVESKGKMGSAIISARACLRSGVGLLTVNIPFEEREIIQISIPEAMVMERENNELNTTFFSAIGMGSGLGISKEAEQILIQLLENNIQPLVLDADALNMISLNKNLLIKIPKETILTPHQK